MRYRLAVVMVVMAVNCWGDVTGEIVKYEFDSTSKTIWVWTQYKVDGVEVVTPYPKINEKYVRRSRYSWDNFVGLTDAEIVAKIEANIKQSCENFVVDTFTPKENDKLVKETLPNLNLVGKKVTSTEVVRKIDTDNNGKADTQVSVKTDGTKKVEELDETTGLVK